MSGVRALFRESYQLDELAGGLLQEDDRTFGDPLHSRRLARSCYDDIRLLLCRMESYWPLVNRLDDELTVWTAAEIRRRVVPE